MFCKELSSYTQKTYQHYCPNMSWRGSIAVGMLKWMAKPRKLQPCTKYNSKIKNSETGSNGCLYGRAHQLVVQYHLNSPENIHTYINTYRMILYRMKRLYIWIGDLYIYVYIQYTHVYIYMYIIHVCKYMITLYAYISKNLYISLISLRKLWKYWWR